MDDNKNKVLRLRDVVLYTVSAMLFMDQIALASSLGPSSLFWWLYVLVLLFLPMAMMTSELGTAFPANGGVYHWVRSAFGFRWGARVSWMYWVNNALWMPSVYTLFGSMLGAFYFPELSLWGKIAIGIALALLTAAFNVVALRLGKWLRTSARCSSCSRCSPWASAACTSAGTMASPTTSAWTPSSRPRRARWPRWE